MENEYLMFNPKTGEHYLFLNKKEEKIKENNEDEDMQILSEVINKFHY